MDKSRLGYVHARKHDSTNNLKDLYKERMKIVMVPNLLKRIISNYAISNDSNLLGFLFFYN